MQRTSSRRRRDLRAVVEAVACANVTDVREVLAEPLLRLLHADHLASYVWVGGAVGYGHRVALNMDPKNLDAYERHFQFHDPVTPKMARFRKAMDVDSVIERRNLECSAFYQDFLIKDGLHHGINRFVYRGSDHVGDLRIWRSASRPSFDDGDLAMLDLVGLALGAHSGPNQANLPPYLRSRLTPREQDVADAVLDGLDDAQLCARLRISYGTVRTHLAHIFEKCGVRTKMGLIAVARGKIDEFSDVLSPVSTDDGPHGDEDRLD